MRMSSLRKSAPTLLSIIGVIGVAATSIMAAKATPKALNKIKEAEEEKGEKLTKVETVKVAGPVYIPAVITGVSTATCIFGANVLNKRQQAALTSVYVLLDSSYKEYKKKTLELYGEDADERIKEGIVKDSYKENDISVEDDRQLFYDDFSGRYFESTIEDVQRAEYRVNRDLHTRGWATINEFYEVLGVGPIDSGDAIGWSEGLNWDYYWQSWIDFTHQKVVMDDGLECYIISMQQEPMPGFEDY